MNARKQSRIRHNTPNQPHRNAKTMNTPNTHREGLVPTVAAETREGSLVASSAGPLRVVAGGLAVEGSSPSGFFVRGHAYSALCACASCAQTRDLRRPARVRELRAVRRAVLQPYRPLALSRRDAPGQAAAPLPEGLSRSGKAA